MKNVEHLLNNARTVHMHHTDKARIREAILAHAHKTSAQRRSTSIYSIFDFTHTSLVARGVAFVLVAMVVSGGTLSYASADTLPGDTLYPVKVRVTEEIQESLAFSPEAKLRVQTKRIERRLDEVQTLLQQKDVSQEKHAIAEALVKEHIASFTQTIQVLQQEGDAVAILEATNDLVPVLTAHKQRIEEQQETNQEPVLTVETASTPTAIETTTVHPIDTPNTIIETTDVTTASLTETPVADIFVAPTLFDTLTSALLTTVETTLAVVEQTESLTLQTLQETGEQETLITITTTQVEQIEEKLKELEVTLPPTEEAPPLSETPAIESLPIDTLALPETNPLEVSTLPVVHIPTALTPSETIKQANTLLEQSKEAYLRNEFTEALRLSQEATKLLRTLEEATKLESRIPVAETILLTPPTTTKKELPVEEKGRDLIDTTIDKLSPKELEAQAKNAIQSLEQRFVAPKDSSRLSPTLPQ